ncbi:MAG: glycoside hydrolase family 16 protein [Muribaculaceae bacterium]|nr:glycoside hydrolase family 16 protein [Muribaculaceae bacterium]
MRKFYLFILLFIAVGAVISCDKKKTEKQPDWVLVWEDDFNTDGVLNDSVWSRIPRGESDWNNYMSQADTLYDVRNGNLILRGIINPDRSIDTVPYLTGGVFTKNKKGFGHGKLEIRAKFGDVTGAWPAIWLLPYIEEKWPVGGEIDIMERLNSDTIAYQTIHSYYTQVLGLDTVPPHYATGKIINNEYNIYSVELHPDSLVFAINGEHTFTYPKIETDKEGQFPFDKEFYLLIDMQLEGNWVGKANPDELPDIMEIDWVRFYQKQ